MNGSMKKDRYVLIGGGVFSIFILILVYIYMEKSTLYQANPGSAAVTDSMNKPPSVVLFPESLLAGTRRSFSEAESAAVSSSTDPISEESGTTGPDSEDSGPSVE